MSAPSIISVKGIEHRYEGVLALSNVNVDIPAGGFVAVLGPNGAGKSTLAKIISGAMRPLKGSLYLDGEDVTIRASRNGLVDAGVALIPEGRRLFGQLTVDENLMLGAYGRPRKERLDRISKVYDLMPEAVRKGKDRAAATLSGGEQQMLAVGRALMAQPRAVLLDEPSLGLAPILTDRVYEVLAELRNQGVAVVVFEQLAMHAMKHADEILVIEHGNISHRGAVGDDATREALRIGYLGHG
jgi:branched-chain amino acid transport system ATP-binding protein